MSCFPFSPQDTVKNLKEKIGSPNTAKKSEDEFPPFMNGNLTSTSTFELLNWEDDSAIGDETSSMKLAASNESILASSYNNSNQDLVLSASKFGKNTVLACSTPKDQVPVIGDNVQAQFADQSPIPSETPNKNIIKKPIKRISTYKYCPPESLDRRTPYLRHLEAARRRGTENIRNSYTICKTHRPGYERRVVDVDEVVERVPQEEDNLDVIKRNLPEIIASTLLALWQLFYLFDVLPSTHSLVFYGNIVLVGTYGLVYIATQPIWYAVIVPAFCVYVGVYWMRNLAVDLGVFAFSIVLLKTIATVIQVVFLILY